ncbi:helix-turn-helix domain-containing protein [Rossellomorea marisflavi]|uniref:recombinase family protein n=1 Tax=Rossellomorea marisflavi TaxID=189381 RepID=UPI001319250B|nr:recombinase family protein [Rossellomorea marisflavi]QHA36863.1 helix-turn-helix domain-containing protein [Rossellomorea marisflavi]
MKIGYARVSTQDQSLDLQVDALQKAGCERIYTEKMSGRKDDRPELQKCLDALRSGDVLVVYKLDRLGRSTFKLLELTAGFERDGVDFVSIVDGIDTTTPVGRFFFRTMASIAELERDIIVERTQAGLQAARARGRVGGRPAKAKKDVERALKLYDSNQYSVPEIVEMTEVSKATLYRAINKRKNMTENKST